VGPTAFARSRVITNAKNMFRFPLKLSKPAPIDPAPESWATPSMVIFNRYLRGKVCIEETKNKEFLEKLSLSYLV
jgi:hypothetical protein